jgi:23S rRNA pseudouridine1911/1915/1917 synthase
LTAAIQGFPRQALHAIRLGLTHPRTGQAMIWEVPMAADLAALLELFRREAGLGPDST